MKHLDQYYDYLLIESVIVASEDVSNILSNLKTKVGVEFWNIINNKQDVTTDFNTLGISDKNDELFFLSDIKTQKIFNDGGDPFGKNKQAMKIGRVARAILSKNNIVVNDKEIEDFVNDYKAQFDIVKNKDKKVELIKLVEGDDIKFWYSEHKYQDEGLYGTELGQSCMRYDKCQRYFDIYTMNNRQCKLLIYLNENNELKARALFWKLSHPENSYYLDRIYSIYGYDKMVLANWICENAPGEEPIIFYDKCPRHDRVSTRSISSAYIHLDNGGSFDYYPYMDTFKYYSPDNDSKLSADEGDLELESTDGTYSDTGVYCDYEGCSYPESDTVYSDFHEVNMLRDNAVYSEFHSSYLWEKDAVFSERREDYLNKDDCEFSKHLEDYIPKDNAVEVYTSDDNSDTDYYDIKDDDDDALFEIDDFSGDKYIKTLLTPTNSGSFVLTKYVINVYKPLDIGLFNNDNKPEMVLEPVVSALDAKLFSINIDINKPIIMDIRSYSAFKLSSGTYDEWVSLVNNTKADKDIKELKLKELKEAHEMLMTRNKDYKYKYLIDKEGGVEQLLVKWRDGVSNFAKTIKRKDLFEAAKSKLGHRTYLFGNYYYKEIEDYNESSEGNKKKLNDLVSILFKCLPNYLSAYKRKGFLHSYTTGSLGDKDVTYAVLKQDLIKLFPDQEEYLNEYDFKIVNHFRSVYGQLLSPFYDDQGKFLATLLQYEYDTNKFKL